MKLEALTMYDRGEKFRKKISFKESKKRTSQDQVNECNINTIVERALKFGKLPESTKEGIFADMTQTGDFAANMEKVTKAKTAFARLPAVVRDHFENNPSKMIGYLADQNRDNEIGYKLGLFKKPPKEAKTVEKIPESGHDSASNTQESTK